MTSLRLNLSGSSPIYHFDDPASSSVPLSCRLTEVSSFYLFIFSLWGGRANHFYADNNPNLHVLKRINVSSLKPLLECLKDKPVYSGPVVPVSILYLTWLLLLNPQ